MFYYQQESKLILNCSSLTESHPGGLHKHSVCQISGDQCPSVGEGTHRDGNRQSTNATKASREWNKRK